MIQVINGKRYNTETAQLVYKHWNGYNRSDFKYRSKCLYRTKNGAWFLHHDGGALSDMAISVSGGRGGSEAIEAIDADDAYGFLEAHSDESEALEAIEKHFADKIVDA